MSDKDKEIQRLQQRIAELEEQAAKNRDLYGKLQESEAWYRMLVEFLPIGIVVHNGKDVLYANQWVIELIGARSEDRLVGHPLKEFVHPDTWGLVVPRVKQLMQERRGVGLFHEKFLKVDGTPFHVEVGAIPVNFNGREAVLVSIRDIDQQVRAQQELEAQRDLAQRYLDVAGVIMLAMDREGRITMVNRKGCEVLGYSNEELIGKDWFRTFLPGEGVQVKKDVFLRLMQGQTRLHTYYEDEVITGSGEHRIIAWYNTILHDEQNRISGTLSSGEDITEKKRVGEELRRQKERLAVTLSSIGDAVIATDAKGRVTLLNGVARDMTGWSMEDAIGRPLPDVFRIVNEKTRKPMEDPVEKVLAMGRVVGLANGTMLLSKDGMEFIIADSGAPIKDAEGNIIGVVMVFRDITQKKHWEDERQRLQRFETLELMAGGIAHDFNNLLTGVLGHLSLLMYVLPEGFSGLMHVEDAQKSVLAARKLVGQLSLLSRGSAPVRENASIRDVVRTSSEISATGSNCQLEVNVADDLWNVICDINQISQVVQNVVINAVQAMPAGGKIIVDVVNQKISRSDDLPLSSGRYVRISVADQGIGVHKKYMDKIFDPYFTTKQDGSGLGLSIVYSVVTRHSGHVDIRSRQGSGSIVTIWLPASVRRKAGTVLEEISQVEPGGRVLVVDDEAVVREVCTKMLRHLGYDAVDAPGSAPAIDMVTKGLDRGEPFDLAIIDLTMPGDMSGKQLCHRLHDVFPGLAIIASSGYPEDAVMLDPEKFGFSGILKKPYTIKELKYSLAKARHEK